MAPYQKAYVSRPCKSSRLKINTLLDKIRDDIHNIHNKDVLAATLPQHACLRSPSLDGVDLGSTCVQMCSINRGNIFITFCMVKAKKVLSYEAYSTKSNMHQHAKIKHAMTFPHVRPVHQCGTCGKIFTRKCGLDTHTRGNVCRNLSPPQLVIIITKSFVRHFFGNGCIWEGTVWDSDFLIRTIKYTHFHKNLRTPMIPYF